MANKLAKEIPSWADDKQIFEMIMFGKMRKQQKDFYTFELIKKLFIRLETLEDCVDEIVAEKD